MPSTHAATPHSLWHGHNKLEVQKCLCLLSMFEWQGRKHKNSSSCLRWGSNTQKVVTYLYWREGWGALGRTLKGTVARFPVETTLPCLSVSCMTWRIIASQKTHKEIIYMKPQLRHHAESYPPMWISGFWPPTGSKQFWIQPLQTSWQLVFWALCLLDYVGCFLTPPCIFYISSCVRQKGRKAISDGQREWNMEVGRERKQVEVWQEIGRKCSCWRSEPVQVIAFPTSLSPFCSQRSPVPFTKLWVSSACLCVCVCVIMV